jgi:hypothetical protein
LNFDGGVLSPVRVVPLAEPIVYTTRDLHYNCYRNDVLIVGNLLVNVVGQVVVEVVGRVVVVVVRWVVVAVLVVAKVVVLVVVTAEETQQPKTQSDPHPRWILNHSFDRRIGHISGLDLRTWTTLLAVG